jgi:predicted molibdopterin-dependent oxidoreductase YjgC
MTLQIGIYDHNTGEQIVRDMTQDELIEYELNANAKAMRQAAEAQAKADKMAILVGLGLTEEQAKVLGLIPSEATPL